MAVVGLEQTFFSVSEGVGVVELCVNVSSPVIDCPIKFRFEIQLSTRDGSAGNEYCQFIVHVYSFLITVSSMDYRSLNALLMFAECQHRSCVDVTIDNDSGGEPDENFVYALSRTPGLHPNIFLDPVTGEIVIVDDDGGAGDG